MTETNTPTTPVSYRMPAGPGDETKTIFAVPTQAFYDLAATIPPCTPGCRGVARTLGPGYDLVPGFDGRVCPLQAAVYHLLHDGERHDRGLRRAERCDAQGLADRAAELRAAAAGLRADAERLAAQDATEASCCTPAPVEAWPPAPPGLAVLRTHQLEWDPPGLSAANRWTCAACGQAAIDYRGNVYGSATTGPCAEAPA
ncbi:hypothetical protein ACFY4B_27390 [Kitasatospora sp. NPDC001261]|uniref:hypothetical protein n=1 Tax=Kitasatospora sp. NPDC001261 TaxID=3364012 RepID=UPI00367FE79F